MQRVFRAIRSALGFVVVAAILGGIAGGALGVRLAVDNAYQQQGFTRLARWVVIDNASQGMLVAMFCSAAILAATVVAWPAARLVLGSWRRALTGALVAMPVLAVYLFSAWYVNRFYLPGFLTAPTLIGNLLLAGLAIALWYGAIRCVEKSHLTRRLSWSTALARPLPLLLMLLAVLVVQSTRVISRPAAGRPGPNVLVIVIDALRPDRLGAYGYSRDTSPNLDMLAGEGWLYTQALTTAPWTKPAIASLFTGLYPRQHGISSANWSRRDAQGATQVSALQRSLITLPEIFAEAGYRTAAFGENHHLIARLGFDQGFEVHQMDMMDRSWLQSLAGRLGLGIADRLASSDRPANTARKINRHFLDWIPAADERFFAYLHHIDVHWPYRAPAPFAGCFGARRTAADFNSAEFYQEVGPQREHADTPPKIDPAVLQDMGDAYDEGIRFVDAELGVLFTELKRRGLYDATLIIVTADHGEQFLEHGEIGHGTSLHDVLLRVPLIIKFPCPGRNCQARRVDPSVQLVDLLPTILAAVGIAGPPTLPGKNISGPLQASRAMYAEMGDQVALRTGQFKLIYHMDESRAELYSLQSDPGERRNLADSDPAVTATFRDRLFAWLDETDQSVAAPRAEVAADAEMLERLQALGYVE